MRHTKCWPILVDCVAFQDSKVRCSNQLSKTAVCCKYQVFIYHNYIKPGAIKHTIEYQFVFNTSNRQCNFIVFALLICINLMEMKLPDSFQNLHIKIICPLKLSTRVFHGRTKFALNHPKLIFHWLMKKHWIEWNWYEAQRGHRNVEFYCVFFRFYLNYLVNSNFYVTNFTAQFIIFPIFIML